MLSVRKGVYDDCGTVSILPCRCSPPLTIVWHRVSNVSKRVFSAATVSSTPSSPLRRLRLKRMYQFVSSSIRSSRRGMTVYKRYAAISSRTRRMSD